MTSIVQPSLVPEVPERIERWDLHAYEDPEGEVYVAYSAETLASALCEMRTGDRHIRCYKPDDLWQLADDAVLENEDTGESVVIAEALATIAERVKDDPTHDPRTAGIVDQIWTMYA